MAGGPSASNPAARVSVAVVDPVPSYRLGLAAGLSDAGFTARVMASPADLADTDRFGKHSVWADGTDRCALLVTLHAVGDWQHVTDLRHAGALANPSPAAVALLHDPIADDYGDVLRMGADGVAAWEAPPDEIAEVVLAAVEGGVLLPVAVARSLALRSPRSTAPSWLTPEEVDWLRLLANGARTQELATAIGYSERPMHRLLRGMYDRIGAANRSAAVVQVTNSIATTAGRWLSICLRITWD